MKRIDIQAQIAAAQEEVEKWPASIKSVTKINTYSFHITSYEEDANVEKEKKKDMTRALTV